MLLNNKYKFDPKTDLIGTGGFAKVYKARDIVLDHEVALKVVVIDDKNAKYSLVAEVKKAIKLNHKNLVRYFDAFVIDSTSVTGEDLQTQIGVLEYISDGHIGDLNWIELPFDKQKDILNGILNGLQYLHSKGIVHRDIKPSNVLIRKEGDIYTPKLTDFGISKETSGKSVSLSGILGSFSYMAPEQFDRKAHIDHRTDIWAFGVLIYRLVTGVLPFGDESTTSEATIIKNISELNLTGHLERVKEPFRKIIQVCLKKERIERPDSISVLIDMLGQDEDAVIIEETEVDTNEPRIARDDSTKIISKDPFEKVVPKKKQKKNNYIKYLKPGKARSIGIIISLIIIVLITIVLIFKNAFIGDYHKQADIFSPAPPPLSNTLDRSYDSPADPDMQIIESPSHPDSSNNTQLVEYNIIVENSKQDMVGDEDDWKCGDFLIDERDGKKYKTVQIGGQCWMAENLNIGKMLNYPINCKDNGLIEKYCYSEDEKNCDIFGGLYQWDELMQYSKREKAQGICPEGWHIPSYDEWSILTKYLGGSKSAASKMKARDSKYWNNPRFQVTNSSGFTALPGGHRYSTKWGRNRGTKAYFWSSTEFNVHRARSCFLHWGYDILEKDSNTKEYCFSVRCIKD